MPSRNATPPKPALPPNLAGGESGRSRPTARRSIPIRGPFPWQAMLRYLGGRLIPNAECADGDVFKREADARLPAVEIHYAPARAQLRLQICGAANAAVIERRARRLFDPDHDAAALAPLAEHPLLRPRILATPGLRPLGCWDPFELCVRTLIGQQVSVRAAQSLTARVVERCGTLQAGALAGADLAQIGMPGRRVAAIQNFAKLVSASAIDLNADWAELEPTLAELPGFGPWTCAYLAIRLGRDPDAFPVADVGLMRAAAAENPKALERMAEAWRPLRAFAATYLWFDLPARPAAPDTFPGE